ncbi:MAG: cold shock domain-containing protein [Paraburkholderia sp.]|jgi:cold shock CspA family protein|uniref:cold shock domain-containing protein n=1 Tax=Burkholderiaceae TaxID=119060 RepID=UPI0010F747B2|nr:cold shock domain-containing protein [Burkholderia sp. 4M9327F10]
MRGTVKWFSQEKGFGFVVGQDNIDYFVGVRDVSGTTLPENGDTVEFEITHGNRGPRATKVTIIQRTATPAQTRHSNDDRAICATCQKKMVPRMITYRGEPKKSVCPFCGATYKDFGWCFIATAVFGDYEAPEVLALRAFRDRVLSRSKVGRASISLYYQVSPPIADFLRTRPRSATAMRFVLLALIRVAKHCKGPE